MSAIGYESNGDICEYFFSFDILVKYIVCCIDNLKKINDYTVFDDIINYISNAVSKGFDINETDVDRNETLLSYLYHMFFDEGLYNCKVYNPYCIGVFLHCLNLGANPFLLSYNPRYGHNEYYPESIFAQILGTMKYLFDQLNKGFEEDSFLIYDEKSLNPFNFYVPEDPYPEYTEEDFNRFFLYKFKYLSQMFVAVSKQMILSSSLCSKHTPIIEYYTRFFKTEFLEVFPIEATSILTMFNQIMKHNFLIFIGLYGFINLSDERTIKRHLSISQMAMKKVFNIKELVYNISIYL
jgi:hypothetical protein